MDLLDINSGKPVKVDTETGIEGIKSGQLKLDPNRQYNFIDVNKKDAFSTTSEDAQSIIADPNSPYVLFDPDDIQVEANLKDEVLGTAIKFIDGFSGIHAASLAAKGVSKALGNSTKEVDFLTESAGSVGTAAEFAGNIASYLVGPSKWAFNLIGKQALKKVIGKEILAEGILNGVYQGSKSFADSIGQEGEVVTDVLASFGTGFVLGGAITGAVQGAGKLIPKAIESTGNVKEKVLNKLFTKEIDEFPFAYGHKDLVTPDFKHTENLKGILKIDSNTPLENLGIKIGKNSDGMFYQHKGTNYDLFFDSEPFENNILPNLLDINNPNTYNNFPYLDPTHLSDDITSLISFKKSLLKSTLKESEVIHKNLVKNKQTKLSLEEFKKQREKLFEKDFNVLTKSTEKNYFGIISNETVYLNKSVLLSKNSKTFLESLNVALKNKPSVKDLSREKRALIKEFGIEYIDDHPDIIEKSFNTLEDLNREYLDKNKGIKSRLSYLYNPPRLIKESINKKIEENNKLITTIMHNNVDLSSQMTLQSKGGIGKQFITEVSFNSDEVINHLKDRFLLDLVDSNGAISKKELYRTLKEIIDDFAKKEFRVLTDGKKIPSKHNIVTYNDFVEKYGQTARNGNPFKDTIYNELLRYSDRLMNERLYKWLKKNKKYGEFGELLDAVQEKIYLNNLYSSIKETLKKNSSIDNFEGVIKSLKKSAASGTVTGLASGAASYMFGGGAGVFVPISAGGFFLGKVLQKAANIHTGGSISKYVSQLTDKLLNIHEPLRIRPVIGNFYAASQIPERDYEKDYEDITFDEMDSNYSQKYANSPISEMTEYVDVLKKMNVVKSNIVKNMPKNVASSSFLNKPITQLKDVRRYNRYMTGVIDPYTVINKIYDGTVHLDELDGLIENYPGMRRLMMESILKNIKSLRDISSGKKEIIKRIMGGEQEDFIPYKIKQDAMSSKNSHSMKQERLRKMNINAQISSMSKSDSLEKLNIKS